MKYMPEEDKYLIVQLPNERLRAIIRRVVTNDAVIVEITSVPLTRTHDYQKGDYVACRRKKNDFGEVWESVAEQKISIEQIAEKEIKKDKESKSKKVVPKKTKKKLPVKKTKTKKV